MVVERSATIGSADSSMVASGQEREERRIEEIKERTKGRKEERKKKKKRGELKEGSSRWRARMKSYYRGAGEVSLSRRRGESRRRGRY